MLTLAANGQTASLGQANANMRQLLSNLEKTKILKWIDAHNTLNNGHQSEKSAIQPRPDLDDLKLPDGARGEWIESGTNYLLPMAFPEGSPMHPSFGAGHATVAGACTTILKAFFDLYEEPNGVVLNPLDPAYSSPDYTDDKWWTKLSMNLLTDQVYRAPDGTMRFESFDGERVILKTNGGQTSSSVVLTILDKSGSDITQQYWEKEVAEFHV